MKPFKSTNLNDEVMYKNKFYIIRQKIVIGKYTVLRLVREEDKKEIIIDIEENDFINEKTNKRPKKEKTHQIDIFESVTL